MIETVPIGRSLSDVCPEFKAKMAEYVRAVKSNRFVADRIFMEAQQIAREFRKKERVL